MHDFWTFQTFLRGTSHNTFGFMWLFSISHAQLTVTPKLS